MPSQQSRRGRGLAKKQTKFERLLRQIVELSRDIGFNAHIKMGHAGRYTDCPDIFCHRIIDQVRLTHATIDSYFQDQVAEQQSLNVDKTPTKDMVQPTPPQRHGWVFMDEAEAARKAVDKLVTPSDILTRRIGGTDGRGHVIGSPQPARQLIQSTNTAQSKSPRVLPKFNRPENCRGCVYLEGEHIAVVVGCPVHDPNGTVPETVVQHGTMRNPH